MKPSRILLAVAILFGSSMGCSRMEARRPLSSQPVYAAPAPTYSSPALSGGSAPAFRPSEGS